jgi:hypothetical protein
MYGKTHVSNPFAPSLNRPKERIAKEFGENKKGETRKEERREKVFPLNKSTPDPSFALEGKKTENGIAIVNSS